MIYIIALPFMLVEYFVYFTIPATAILAYAMVGLEIISDEIEQPFGTDNNDLPLEHLSSIIKTDVYETLQVTPEYIPKKQNIESGVQR
jgi:putative membrane protein